jgi:hypothetical protein
VGSHALRAGVQNDFGHHASYKEPHQADGEAEAGPVVPVLHDLQGVTFEVDLSVKVLLVESLHGDFVAAIVFLTILLVVEGKVVLDRLARELGLLILARRESGVCSPEGGEYGDAGEEAEEDGRLEAASELPREIPRNNGKEGEEGDVGEGLAARPVGRKGRILDGGILHAGERILACVLLSGWTPASYTVTGEIALTSVVLTPQSGAAASERGAGGVSTNSKESSDAAFSWSAMVVASN